MNFANALFIIGPLILVLALRTLYLDGVPSFFNFLISYNIFIVKIYFLIRKSTLSLNNLT